MLEVAALIGTPVTILSGYFLPFIYESYGLTVNYDVLYDPNVRNSLFYMLCALSILGAALNLAPYFLYNLSREKHSMVVLALKYRAANTDYRTGDITPHQVKDLVESYNYMVERRDAVQPDTNEKKAEMKAAKQVFKTAKAEYESLYESIEKATPKGQAVVKTEELLALEEVYHQKKQAYKDAKFAYKDACKLRRDKEAIEEFIDTELGKWDTPKSQVRLALAKAITSIDKNDVADTAPDLSSIELPDLTEWTVKQAEAKQRRAANRRFFSKDKDVSEYMPWAEKKAERTLRSLRSLIKRTELRYRLMQKLSKLFFKNGLEYDYEEAYKKELDVQCFTREEKKAQNKRIRSAQFKYNRFASAYKLYIESETLLLDFGDRNNFFDYILPMYDECVIEAERIDREEEEKAKAEKEAKNAEIAEIKLEKRMRKDAKKEAKANGAKFDEAYFEQFKRDHADDYVTPATAEDVSSDADPGEVADAADSADNGAETAAKEDNDNEN